MSERSRVLAPFEEHQDLLDERVAAGIEQNRKRNGTLRFVTADGAPVTDVRVSLKQMKHEFLFGANCFMLGELPDEEINRSYETYFTRLFNEATIPFYWRDLEPVEGAPRYRADSPRVYRRPPTDLCVDWCEAHGVTPKAHCLNYAPFTPAWVPKTIADEKRLLEKRFRELSERYADRIPGWEVTNETLFRHPEDPSMAFYNDPDFVNWSFRLAERWFGGNELIINDAHCNIWDVFNGPRSNYYLQIKDELARGSRIDTIGMQFHMFNRREEEIEKTRVFYDPRRLYGVMDRYADFGKPLQLTELTVPAYSGGAEDEEIQAEILEKLYSIWFSHPNMEAIIYWNLIDGYAYLAEPGDMTAGENYYYGGLVRFDNTPKPAYERLYELIHRRWHTETSFTAGPEAAWRGFCGDYALTAEAGGRVTKTTLHLGRDTANEFTVTLN